MEGGGGVKSTTAWTGGALRPEKYSKGVKKCLDNFSVEPFLWLQWIHLVPDIFSSGFI